MVLTWVGVGLLLGGILFTTWVFLRPDGLVNRAVDGRDLTLKSLQDSSLVHLQRIEEMAVQIQAMNRNFVDLEAKVQSRLSSMESKIGKQSKDELRERALEAIRNQQIHTVR